MSKQKVSVPLDLLRKALASTRCEQYGAWCDQHDAQRWPCPMEQVRRLLPHFFEAP